MSGGIVSEKGPGDMKLVYSQARDQFGPRTRDVSPSGSSDNE